MKDRIAIAAAVVQLAMVAAVACTWRQQHVFAARWDAEDRDRARARAEMKAAIRLLDEDASPARPRLTLVRPS